MDIKHISIRHMYMPIKNLDPSGVQCISAHASERYKS